MHQGTGAVAAAAPGASRLQLSRGAFAAATIGVAALAGTAGLHAGADGALASLAAALALNKVLWLCLGIAAWHLCRQPAQELRARDLLIASPALALAALATGSWPWLGLGCSLGLWARAMRHPAARTGLMLALAVAAHEVAVGVLGELAGDPLLDLDARIAGTLARWLQPGLVVWGTSLKAGEGPMVILVWGCSSLSHVGELLLLCWALTSLQRDDARPVSQARMAACLALLALFAVALNATRLMLMATSLESYEYLHGPQGGALFRCTLLVLAAAMSGACARAAAS